ncbi:MAG: succinyl-diaminopimelate desuccinylase [Alphaproteobacteria bacterium]|nr:succinyl-diaminopimelate desuccinylase [Alphaproteobacteria bacterium]
MRDVTELAKALIACPSVTPETAGVFDVIEEFLVPLGFVATRATFAEEGTAPVENLYLRYGTSAPNFCFAGHTDVVPVGDPTAWRVPPFAPEVIDGELIGRGAEDMKGAIAAFMVAVREFLHNANEPCVASGEPRAEGVSEAKGMISPSHKNFSISLLITQDEEGVAINGTRKMLEFLTARGEKLDVCIVGEPTNPTVLGEMAKIGRRGSISFVLEVSGRQGHVAYPSLADNPVTRLIHMLHALYTKPLDEGNAFFPPSNLEVTSVDVGNPTVNMIPGKASAQFNVRFNNLHTSADIEAWVRARLDPRGSYSLTSRLTGESFLTKDDALATMVVEAVSEITGLTPNLSTTGGTSDARFIKDYCPVIEFGATGRTSHMVDERVEVKTLEGLVKIYQRMLEKYFKG